MSELQQKRVVVIGAGWAGLGATYHLAKQGYDVTLLEAGPYPGGLVAGWQTSAGKSVEAGIHGFWVAMITGQPWLGLAEWVIHSFIDIGKCRRYYRLAMDQSLHLLCKVVWVVILVSRLGLPLV